MTSTLCYLIPLFVLAVVLDIFLVTGLQRMRKLRREVFTNDEEIKVSRRELWLRAFFPSLYQADWQNAFFKNPQVRRRFANFLELTVLAIWAMMLGSQYLDMDPRIVPAGHEFGSAIQSHHLWTQFQKCGLCALWNGFERGGYPAFADIQGSMLHPLVAVTTLLWGVINGVKISLIVTFWSAGLAQWWIAHELGLGWLPRMWSAGIAIAGGHLAGRMELGVFGVTLATAMASLVFAGILHMENARSGRAAVLLGVVLALTVLSGQGYMQVGLLAILPALLVLLLQRNGRFLSHWKYYLFASLLGLLLAAPLLIPLLHFSPNIAKHTDPTFGSAQPLQYFVLNLVIDNVDFYWNASLGKLPFPHLYSLYIGWIPVGLALLGLTQIYKEKWRIFAFVITAILLVFLIASAVILKPLVGIVPSVAGIRHPAQIGGLAIPLILALSAYGLEKLLNWRWPRFSVWSSGKEREQPLLVPLSWICLVPLLLSLKSSYEYSKVWLTTLYRDDHLYEILSVLETSTIQWVGSPFGEHGFIEPAIGMGLKLSPGFLTWGWRGRVEPAAIRSIVRGGSESGTIKLIGHIKGMSILENKAAEYAVIEIGKDQYPCRAHGSGGMITVNCETEMPGLLKLKEYVWSGWRVSRDGKAVDLVSDETWLKVQAPPGRHVYTFTYLPWDVPLGIFLFICGLIACIILWQRPTPTETIK